MTAPTSIWNLDSSIVRLLAPLPFSEQEWRLKVLTQLSNQDISASELIALLSENPKLKKCCATSAGVDEGYTVGRHTEMVLELAQRYR